MDLVIAGPTLRLRYATGEDAGRFYELASEPEVTQFFSWSYTDPSDASEWIAGIPERRSSGELLDFVIEHHEHGVIGSTGLGELSRRDRRAMVGTWLGRPYWGTEANAESKALVSALCFERLGLERLGAYASDDNPRSQRALARLGFQREGLLREFHRHGGRAHDLVVYGLLRADWEASPLRGYEVSFSGDPPEEWVIGR